jgi:uncharacterized membrane protein
MIPRPLMQILRGFAMGSADIVPGVSGGTVALVLGIYNDLIGNIRTGASALGSFVKGDVRGGIDKLKTVDWLFLIPLAAGVGLALVVLTSVIERLLEERPVEMAGLFFGLILASIVVAWRLIKNATSTHIGIAVAVGLIMFALLGLRDISTDKPTAVLTAPNESTYELYFEYNSSELTKASEETLDDLAAALEADELGGSVGTLTANIYLDAHDDDTRSQVEAELTQEQADASLADLRLLAVADALAERGQQAGTTAADWFASNEWERRDDKAPVWAFLMAGALAICAMILPGISGSLILVLLAMYQPVLAAAHDRDVVSLGIFMVGAVIGLAVFSQLLSWLLEHHHDVVIAVLIGLMIGSLRILWPWPQGIDGTDLGAPGNPLVLPIVLAVVAIGVVLGVSAIADRSEHGAEAAEPVHAS